MAMKISGLSHECGVFGAISTGDWPSSLDIPQIICLGLEALQHRGQESTGIVTSENNNDFHVHKGMGLVKNVYDDDSIKKLKGSLGIGHTRYSTSAASKAVNCQPFVVHSVHGALAVAHNGELMNSGSLRRMVLERGVGLSTHSDSELITQALCLIPPEGEVDGPDWPARIRHLMQLAPLSYSLVIMLKDRIYAVRDPYGNRPLCLGRILPVECGSAPWHNQKNEEGSDGWVVSSESCAFLSVTRYVREVLPGEIVELTKDGIRSVDIVSPSENSGAAKSAFCIFEYVYFARPNSIFEGQEVYAVRERCGRHLALEHPVDADVVGSVPESGNAAAFGYSKQSKIPFGELLNKNAYVGRSFIQPTNRLRQLNVALKFNPISSNVKNKRLILIDDSIVRGNTMGPIIKLLRRAGAREVHVRIASPPLRHPCYMGINIPTKEELIANALNCEELAKHVGADSLEYLSVDGLVKAVKSSAENGYKSKNADNYDGYCTACLTGIYPAGLPEQFDW